MDPAGHSGTDHTDHSYPYKNEVSLSIGGGNDQPATISPTPTPRNNNNGIKPREQPPSVPSTAQHKDNVAMLTRSNNDEKRSGLDNPGYESEPTTKAARPLSSFGQNGQSGEAVKSQNGNGNNNGTTPVTKGSEKPLAGNLDRNNFIKKI